MTYEKVFTKLDLATNEAKIYEALLRYGQSGVSSIATKSNINRRNVYDSLNRLIEKGLVFEIRTGGENAYQAVDPNKLMELVKEKETALETIMPELTKLYGSTPHEEEVFIYKGIEGFKNYIRDLVRTGEDPYIINGRGFWANEKVRPFMNKMMKEMKKKGLSTNIMFDPEIRKRQHEIQDFAKSGNWKYRFLPEGFSSKIALDMYGPYTAIIPGHEVGEIPDDMAITVIVNQDIADGFRTWFKLLWEMSEEPKKANKKGKN